MGDGGAELAECGEFSGFGHLASESIELGFGFIFFGDVAADELDVVVVVEFDGSSGDDEVSGLAGEGTYPVPVGEVALLEDLLIESVSVPGFLRGGEVCNVHAFEVLCGAAGHFDGASVEFDDSSGFRVDEDDGIGGLFEEGAVSVFGESEVFFDFFLVRDIVDDGEGAAELAVFVEYGGGGNEHGNESSVGRVTIEFVDGGFFLRSSICFFVVSGLTLGGEELVGAASDEVFAGVSRHLADAVADVDDAAVFVLEEESGGHGIDEESILFLALEEVSAFVFELFEAAVEASEFREGVCGVWWGWLVHGGWYVGIGCGNGGLHPTFFQAFEQSCKHPGDFFEFGAKLGVLELVDESVSVSNGKQRNTLLSRTAGNDEEALSIRLGEAAVAFGEIGGDGEGGAVELINQEVVSSREIFGEGGKAVGEIDCFLIDLKVFKHEGHRGHPAVRRAVEQ